MAEVLMAYSFELIGSCCLYFINSIAHAKQADFACKNVQLFEMTVNYVQMIIVVGFVGIENWGVSVYFRHTPEILRSSSNHHRRQVCGK